MYSLLEMKTGLMETEFRLGFSRLVRAICKHGGIACSTITQVWYRNSIKNDVELAQICRDSEGIISRMTILKNHPFVEDAEAELKQLEKEEQGNLEKMNQYGGAFGNNSKDPDDSGGEGDEE